MDGVFYEKSRKKNRVMFDHCSTVLVRDCDLRPTETEPGIDPAPCGCKL